MANIVTELEHAALLGNIDKLYEAIDNDPAILEDVDAKHLSIPLCIVLRERGMSILPLRLGASFPSPIYCPLSLVGQWLMWPVLTIESDDDTWSAHLLGLRESREEGK
ncbi:hypothetical protein PIB30_046766 [Stylosanthes scabra]|uniref:Uncharacterized protein n=1 Tax=Stylosanthes scabra TaxID=79078 RepID=A0ABU6WF21_9FABA|nr:hypothetical protein [Stylosanthes scabra]